ncbi:MAG: penicillin-binding protein 1C, partial [Bacteroidota bacterium]
CCVGYLFWPLPAALRVQQQVTSTNILDRDGRLLRTVRPNGQGIPVAAADIDPFVLEAVVAVEDRHFYQHPGINPLSIVRALVENTRAGAVVRGGSTLTMQVARTLRGNQSRTLYQKTREALLAVRLEAQLSKEDILLLWLNRVYFGNQIYGIEAAASRYFGKSAIDLNKAEASFLVGLPQRPNAFNPYTNLDAAVQRQHHVLDALTDTGVLSSNERETLAAIPLSVLPADNTFKAPHFVNYILQKKDHADVKPATIRTTLHLPLQEEIEALARVHLKRLGNERATNAAVLVIENSTGHILAYVGSADFWNTHTEGQNDGVLMQRQPGSALKPFTYALALASGKYTPATILPDIAIHIPEAGGAFSPMNYDKKFHGPVPFRTALASSYNVPAVRLLREQGTEALLDLLHDTGVSSLQKGAAHYGVGLTLGNGEVQLIELASAYAMLANQGLSRGLVTTMSQTDLSGSTTLHAADTTTVKVLSQETAYLITDILQDPEARAPAFGRYGPLEMPFPAAVKTGTSKDYRDNWAVGYTPQHTVAVWVGNFNGSPMRRVSGVSGAGPLYHGIMALLGPGGTFAIPEKLKTVEICPVSGHRPGQACPGIKKEFFLPHAIPTDTCTVHQIWDIDKRSGFVALPGTPKKHITPTRFTVYPPPYEAWAATNGIAQPQHPAGTPSVAHVAAQQVPNDQRHNGQTTMPRQLQILYPKAGMTFQLDPVLKPGFQQIHLQGTSHGVVSDAKWWINESPVSGPIQSAFWQLEAGQHTIELRGVDQEGHALKSLPISIRVLSYTEAHTPAF